MVVTRIFTQSASEFHININSVQLNPSIIMSTSGVQRGGTGRTERTERRLRASKAGGDPKSEITKMKMM